MLASVTGIAIVHVHLPVSCSTHAASDLQVPVEVIKEVEKEVIREVVKEVRQDRTSTSCNHGCEPTPRICSVDTDAGPSTTLHRYLSR